MSRKLTKTLAVQILILSVLVIVSAACSTSPPPPTNPPSNPPISISATPTLKPNLVLDGAKETENNGIQLIEYQLKVSNWEEFPDPLFEAAPDLPPCGQNTNASRTWVDIYNADSDAYIYGFCGFGQSENLESFWFAVKKGDTPPNAVYVILNDRQTNIQYRSNNVSISPAGDNPQPTGKAELELGEAHIESFNNSYYSYQIEVGIANLGNAVATGFTVYGTYKCPPGETTISDGFVVVQGGYLAANSSFTYTAPFHYGCLASPPTVDLVFTIESPEGGTQTYAPVQVSFP